jgi:hypothetical protein
MDDFESVFQSSTRASHVDGWSLKNPRGLSLAIITQSLDKRRKACRRSHLYHFCGPESAAANRLLWRIAYAISVRTEEDE